MGCVEDRRQGEDEKVGQRLRDVNDLSLQCLNATTDKNRQTLWPLGSLLKVLLFYNLVFGFCFGFFVTS